MSDPLMEKVRAESERFEKALPDLLATIPGRWVIYLEGEVRGDFATEDDAYAAALERYDIGAGFVIAPVIQPSPVPVTAGYAFGIA